MFRLLAETILLNWIENPYENISKHVKFQTPCGDNTFKLAKRIECPERAFAVFQTPCGDNTFKPPFVMPYKRVVITGMTFQTPCGDNTFKLWFFKRRKRRMSWFPTPCGVSDSLRRQYFQTLALETALQCGLKWHFAARKLFSDNFKTNSPPKVLQTALQRPRRGFLLCLV